ncbi:MAG: HAMP domain-containing histidine kinase [Planctomycetaceae bacterium]|nr:HAMP domain-containing histidine kinase [Planctomycetaceae bacterium]
MLAESPAEFLVPWSQAQQLQLAAVLDELGTSPLPQGTTGGTGATQVERFNSTPAIEEIFSRLFSREPLLAVAAGLLAFEGSSPTSLKVEAREVGQLFPQALPPALANPSVVVAGLTRRARRLSAAWLSGLFRLLNRCPRTPGSEAQGLDPWLGPTVSDDLPSPLQDLVNGSYSDWDTIWRRVLKLQPIAAFPVLQVAAGDYEDPRYRAQQNGLLSRIELIRMRLAWEEDVEREKLASLKRLAYGASHEINNPLANIATRAQTLLRKETELPRRQSLETINAQAFRAFDMLANLMHYAAPPSAAFQMTDLIALAKQCSREVQSQWLGQFKPEWSSGAETLELEVDPTQVSVMIQALLRNACEACGPQGTVRLSVDRCEGSFPDENWVVIGVWDDGPAVSTDMLKIMCDPFYSGREAGRGLGFGLAKSLRIVEAHAGYLAFEPQSPQGLLVTAYLPLRDQNQKKVEE